MIFYAFLENKQKMSLRFYHIFRSIIVALVIGLLTITASAREVELTSKQVANNMKAMDHFIRGVVADKVEDYYRAVFEYQEALEADPNSPFIYVALAQDYILLNKVSQALELLEKALDINPDYVPALELYAGLLLNTEQLSKALGLFEHLARLDTSEIEYSFQLLRLYLRKGDFDSADRMYERMVAIEGESQELLLQVATVLLMGDSTQRATPYLERLAELDSTDAAVLYTLGTLSLQHEDTLSAENYFRNAVMYSPEVPRYWMGLAILQMDREDYAGACQTLEQSVDTLPDAAGLWSLLGTCQSQLGDTANAIVSLKKTIALDTTNYAALGVLALIYERQDSIQKVCELYERAIELSDSAAVFLNNYAYTLAERGLELGHAKEMSDKACEIEPDNSAYLDTKAWIFFQQGDHRSAIRWIRRALKIEPHSAPIWEHLGDVYQSSGSQAKARKYYRRALKEDPKSETVRSKLGL
jgi:tetratricopeptide (TPR) repeat protein